MEDLKKKIEEAAIKYAAEKGYFYARRDGFEAGALSPEAKEYWQEEMFSIKEMDKWIVEKKKLTKQSKKYIEGLEDTINIVSAFIERNKKL